MTMPSETTPLTDRQEQFCQVYIETGIQAEAYRRAYPKSLKWKRNSLDKKASVLMAMAKISRRVAELRAEHSARHNVTVDSLTADLQRIMAGAEGVEQQSAAVAAVMGIAKMHGLLVDRVETGGQVEFNLNLGKSK